MTLPLDDLVDVVYAVAIDPPQRFLFFGGGGLSDRPEPAEWITRQVLPSEGVVDFTVHYRSQQWFEHRGRVSHSDGQRVLTAVARDVSMTMTKLAPAEFSAVGSSEVLVITDTSRTVTYADPEVIDLLGYRPEDLVGRSMPDLIHPHDADISRQHSSKLNQGQSAYLRGRIRNADGEYRWILQHVLPVVDRNGQVVERRAVWRDVTTDVTQEDAIARREQIHRSVMNSAPEAMAVTDLDRRFVEVNPALCKLLGYDSDWLLAHRVPDVLTGDSNETDLRIRADLISAKTSATSGQIRMLTSAGAELWVQEAIGLLRDEDSTPTGFVCHFVDITSDLQQRAELEHAATHDSLTGLHNRAWLTSLLKSWDGISSALLFIDLDDLKAINDNQGHLAGDKALRVVAECLQTQARKTDAIARIGGDEFVVGLPGVETIVEADQVAGKMHAAIAEAGLSVSIGIAVREPGESSESYLARADSALYQAKASGKGRTVFS